MANELAELPKNELVAKASATQRSLSAARKKLAEQPQQLAMVHAGAALVGGVGAAVVDSYMDPIMDRPASLTYAVGIAALAYFFDFPEGMTVAAGMAVPSEYNYAMAKIAEAKAKKGSY